MALHLRTLGTTALFASPDTSEPLLGPGKPLALLVYLALAPRRTASREHLVDLLWSDAAPDGARRNLRQVIYLLRRLLGDDALAGDGGDLTLRADITTDHAVFTAAVASGDAAAAVAAYGGPFFSSFAAPGGAGFEHWADLERQRLHAAWLRAIEARVREALGRHQSREAVALAVRLRDAGPDRESGWRLLLETLAASGDWLRAAAEADACETHLRDQSRVPEPATAAAIRGARQAPGVAAGGEGRLVAEMVGREVEFAALVTAWGDAERARPHHLHVIGAAGLGKTRLLRDVAARIAALGGRPVLVRANQAERTIGAALVTDLVRALATLPGAGAVAPATASTLLALDPALATRFPAARPALHSAEDTARLRALALADLAAAVADEAPVALLVDDIHYADPDSRRILGALLIRLQSARVMLVTTARPVADGAAPGTPDETLTLRPLAAADIEQLLGSMAALPDGLRSAGVPDALAEASEGSPLQLLETLHLALEQGWLSRDGETWTVRNPEAFGRHLRAGSALDRRLAELADAERVVLLLLAAAGRPLATAVLDAACHARAVAPSPALAVLEARGFAAPTDGSWELTHDLVAERALAAASESERRGADAALAAALLQAEPGDGQAARRLAARHLERAGDEGTLLHVFVAYARAARRLGDRRPLRTLALDVAGDAGGQRAEWLVRHAPLRLRVGRPLGAAVALGAALVLAAAGWAWLTKPVALVVRAGGAFVSEMLDAPFVVEALDRRGRLATGAHGALSVTLLSPDTGLRLEGVAAAPLREGRATIDSLRVTGIRADARLRPIRLRFSMGAELRAESSPLAVGVTERTLRLRRAAVNGQVLSPATRLLRAAPGDSLIGEVELEASAYAKTAAQLLVIVPTWGDRRRTVLLGTALPTRMAGFPVRLELRMRGPDRPGRYWIVFAFAMETEASFIAAGSNWSLGAPRWFDGNDLVDLPAERLREANLNGGLFNQWDFPRPISALAPGVRDRAIALGANRPSARGTLWVPLTAIEVVVR